MRETFATSPNCSGFVLWARIRGHHRPIHRQALAFRQSGFQAASYDLFKNFQEDTHTAEAAMTVLGEPEPWEVPAG